MGSSENLLSGQFHVPWIDITVHVIYWFQINSFATCKKWLILCIKLSAIIILPLSSWWAHSIVIFDSAFIYESKIILLTSFIQKVIKFSQHICSNLLTVCQAWNEYLPYIKISAFQTSINDVTTSRIKSAATFIKSEVSVSANNMQNSSIIFTSFDPGKDFRWPTPRFTRLLIFFIWNIWKIISKKLFFGLLSPLIADNCFLPRA